MGVIGWLHAGILTQAENIRRVKRICGQAGAQHRRLEALGMGVGDGQVFLALGPDISSDNADAEIQLRTAEARATLEMVVQHSKLNMVWKVIG